ncbi:MAG: hypothetical protein F4Y20_03340 [Acidobacteria bacterium]|nr:hypothetical protein [Acidobacteriota bacterium]MYH21726.1 hypothetical protein [Acidobacteriota bacterium]MYK78405.1 hypothetical protein [Acidobacteriota bacterium]
MKAANRARLHDLADQLPDTQTAVAVRVLESLAGQPSLGRRPVAALPLDEDELSDEALRAIEEAFADRIAGRAHSSDEVKRELGI